MVSAIRVDGKRLHELAREGIEIDRQPRPVTVDRFDVTATDDPSVLAIDVVCSGGTYVRTLAADLGHLLGGGAHLRNLRRTAVGPYTLGRGGPARTTASCCAPIEAVRGMPSVVVDEEIAALDRQRPRPRRPRRRRPVGDGRPRRPVARRLRAVPRRARPNRPSSWPQPRRHAAVRRVARRVDIARPSVARIGPPDRRSAGPGPTASVPG